MKLELVGSVFALLLAVFFGGGVDAPTPDVKEPRAESSGGNISGVRRIPPSLHSQSALISCLCDEPPLFEKSSATPLPLASVTKIMTAYLALRELGPDYQIHVSQEAIATEGIAGDLQAGEIFTLKDLIAMMMTYSSNDAAMTVAEALGRAYLPRRAETDSARLGKAGDSQRFNDAITQTVWLINEEAQLLGMQHTMFQNPTGLDLSRAESRDLIGPSNFSTAHDMLRLLRAAQSQPLLWDLSRINNPRVISQQGIAHELLNLNPFRDFPHYVGGKTGTTDYAGENLVMLFEKPLGKPHALILLGAPPTQREAEAQKLLDWIANFN